MNIFLKNSLWCIMKTRYSLHVQGNSFVFASRRNWKQHWHYNHIMLIQRRWSTINSTLIAFFTIMFFLWKFVIHTIDTDVIILLIAYLVHILRRNLNVLVYAKMMKSGVYHDIRTIILTLDHFACVVLTLCISCLRHSVQFLM